MTSKVIRRHVAEIIGRAGRYPFLFVGSGFSQRYLHTPTWVGLLQRICKEAFEDDFAYARYLHKAKAELGLSSIEPVLSALLPRVASLMEPDVDRAILEGRGRLAKFRSKHAEGLASGKVSPMKAYVCDMLDSYSITDSQELASLKKAADKLSGIITTNYDTLCENVFASYTPYVGERGMLFNDPTYSQEIYKIHGSTTDPNSIVLTEGDYRAFESGKDYLAAKLLTIFMEYPVVFLGYSIQDENVRRVLSSVAKCAGPDMLAKVRDRLIFVQYDEPKYGPVGTALVPLEGQAVEMTSVTTLDFTPIYQGIADVRKLYEPRLIKDLRGSIFRLARQVDPDSEIVTAGIDSLLERFGPNDKVVVGLGVSKQNWGMPIDSTHLYEDVVFDNQMLDPEMVVRSWLERLIRQGAVPINKYVAAYDGELYGKVREERSRQAQEGLGAFIRGASMRKGLAGQRERLAGKLSVRGIIDEFGEQKAFNHLYMLETDEIDADELHEYLVTIMKPAKGSHAAMERLLRSKPEIRRVIRIYDYIRYYSEGQPQ